MVRISNGFVILLSGLLQDGTFNELCVEHIILAYDSGIFRLILFMDLFFNSQHSRGNTIFKFASKLITFVSQLAFKRITVPSKQDIYKLVSLQSKICGPVEHWNENLNWKKTEPLEIMNYLHIHLLIATTEVDLFSFL